MDVARMDANFNAPFEYENLQEIINACSKFYHSSIKKVANAPDALKRRDQLSQWVRKFHRDCGTLTPRVEEALEKLREEPCLFFMTAHQPNLFAYSGVIRKATLNCVLAEKLSESLNLPAINFFGIADQDFTDDRWVKSALIPDVERREGIFELRFALPEKLMLNRIAKPSRQILDNWRNEIENWIYRKLNSVNRLCKLFGIKFSQNSEYLKNFEDFWKIVEDAYDKAKVYSDFNAFILSKIVNDIWGYGTLFCRFSECQQIFEREFCFLLSQFEKYSQYVKEATLCSESQNEGVYEQEYYTIPFWYHCNCGSKARLTAVQESESFIGRGECLRCEKKHQIDFSSKKEPKISQILDRISARSITMPLTFFNGLKVCCYIGGVGGKEYLRQAKYVAEHMGIAFPPVIIWRPHDIYFGLGQLEALMTFRSLSGTFDFSQYPAVKASLKKKIADIQQQIDELESQKKKLADEGEAKKEERIEKIRALATEQNEIRRQTNFPILARNLGLLENMEAVMRLHPSIIDYAINIGLKDTSDQWIAFLEKNGNLLSNVILKTNFDGCFPMISHKFGNK